MSYKYKLYGAILGDLCGQPFEFKSNGYSKPIVIHNEDSVITDDTYMTLASAQSILDGTEAEVEYKAMGSRYPGDHYGKGFKIWLRTPFRTLNNSWGNGCLMRASPFMYLKDSLAPLINATRCSHNDSISYDSVIKLHNLYKEGSAKNIGWLNGFDKFEVRADKTIDFCAKVFSRDWSTVKSIEFAVKCGGDTDTNASIIGELCNHYHKDLTKEDIEYVESKLDPYLLGILHKFNERINDI